MSSLAVKGLPQMTQLTPLGFQRLEKHVRVDCVEVLVEPFNLTDYRMTLRHQGVYGMAVDRQRHFAGFLMLLESVQVSLPLRVQAPDCIVEATVDFIQLALVVGLNSTFDLSEATTRLNFGLCNMVSLLCQLLDLLPNRSGRRPTRYHLMSRSKMVEDALRAQVG